MTELREGARGVDVRVAQQLLNDGPPADGRLAPDGVFGPLTTAAARDFQRHRRLEVDGVIGSETWAALTAFSNPAPSAAAKPRPQVTAAPASKPAESTAPAGVGGAAGPLPPELASLDVAGEPAWLKVALAEYGVHERTALGSKRIVQYHQATSLHATSDQVAWCSSFVNWCLAQVGVIGTRSAAAASWAGWGIGLTTPKLGCIVQLHHHVKGYTSATGTATGNHVAFFIRQDTAHIHLLGGNQSDSVKLSIFPLSKWSVTAYRWPGGGR